MDVRNHYSRTARWLHWAMAAMILSMIFVGVAMVASLVLRPLLLDIHRPLGLLVLVLAVLRLWHRRRHPPPALPADLPAPQAFAARASHGLLYALMFAPAGHADGRRGRRCDGRSRRPPRRSASSFRRAD